MNKKNLILGGVLIILITFAYIQRGPWQEWKTSAGKPDNFLSEIQVDGIEMIEIKQGTSTTILLREDSGWKVAGTKDFYIPEQAAAQLEQVIDDMARSELEVVSKNKDKKGDFWTNEEEGVRVKLSQGQTDHEFIIGKTGTSVSNSYISRLDDKNTYLIDINLRPIFIRDDWRDGQILSFLPERIKKVRFQYPNREFTAEKIDNTWKGVSPYEFEVDEEKLKDVLEVMGTLNAADIPEQTFEGTGLEKHSIIVEATDTLGVHTIMVGDANDEGLYYAKRGDSDNIYLITEEEKGSLDINISDLK